MVNKQKILIVDDDANIAELISLYLTKECFDTMIVEDGESALRAVDTFAPNLILLDLMLPGIDGYQVCREVRSSSSVPIIMLSAKGEIFDKVLGLELGADDYVVKPFSLDELGARVEAHLRRDDRQASRSRMRFEDDLVIDYSERAVYYKQQQIPLAKKEFDIIEFLSLNSGQVFDKERIYERLWSWDSDGDSAVVAEHIRRIRAKLSGAGSRTHIETVWGVGYKWVK